MNEKRAIEAYNAAVALMEERAQAIDEAGEDADIDELVAAFDEAKEDVERCRRNKDKAREISEARATSKPVEIPADTVEQAEAQRAFAQPAGSTREEHTYRPDKLNSRSFFADQYARLKGDREAAERLERNNREALDAMGAEYRDMSNTTAAGEDFLPPLYMADMWVSVAVAGRPFAERLPRFPLPAFGTDISIPHFDGGVSVAGRADAGTVSETDGTTANITHDVNEIAGQVDIGRIAAFRSFPGLDAIVGQMLVKRYNAYLDTQLLSGSGTAPQHRGIRAVSGINTVTYTDATPTAGELLPKIYDAIQQNWDDRKGESVPDLIVLHPRRAAALAAGLSSTFPLFQQGGLNQAAGTQDNGFVGTIAGLPVVVDPNIGTTYGDGTDEDEIYVVNTADLFLAEGPLQSRVFEDVLSGTGVIRYQVFSYSAFLSKRYPEAICKISGTGLAAPTF